LALVYGDRSFVSIATGRRMPATRAPSMASVVTAEDIAAMGATTIDEALESVPGLHVTRSSIRYAPTYVIRGLGGGGQLNAQVLVLQNGIPVTIMFSGDKGITWTGVPVENIARIEVIRGPGSALYGADAYAGVINLITKTAEEISGTELGARSGSFDTRDAWVQHGGRLGMLEAAGYFRVGTSNGSREIIHAKSSPAPGPISTDYDAADGSLNLALDKWRLRSSYKLRDHLGTGAGVSTALDPTSKGRAEQLTADLSWTDGQLARDWGVGFTAAFLYNAQTYPNNIQLLPPLLPSRPNGQIGGPNQWERQLRLSAFATYSGFADHSLRFGIGHDDLDLYKVKTVKNYHFVGTTVVYDNPPVATDYTAIQPHIRPHRRQVAYAYAQDEWRFARDWTFTAGLRQDSYDDFGGTTNPRLALVWEAAYDVTAKLLYGRAFRAPSFNELYGINPVNNSNPDLRPETIGTTEAALSWQARQNLQLNFSVFHYDAKDLIRLLSGTYSNIGSVRGNGMEVEATWDASTSLRVTGNYAYQQSIDGATSTDAGYAPRHHLYLRVDNRLAGDWLAGVQVNRVADRRRALGDARPAVADYNTMDLTLRTQRPGWNFVASLRNLFGSDAREPSIAPAANLPDDLPLPHRTFYLQASYTL
jgi:iron complex outermembrane receptor protein